jgi:hypothetical protein
VTDPYDRRDASRAATPRSGRRISPGVVFLGVALLASIAYVLYAVTVRDASQIPLLASGTVVLALAFGALTVYCFGAVLRAGREGRGTRALLIALVGGGAAVATAGCLAGALILFQLAAGG